MLWSLQVKKTSLKSITGKQPLLNMVYFSVK